MDIQAVRQAQARAIVACSKALHLINHDQPESAQPYAVEARSELKKLVKAGGSGSREFYSALDRVREVNDRLFPARN